MDWLDQYLEGLNAPGAMMHFPPDKPSWNAPVPSKQQMAWMQDATIADMVRMRNIQEARQAEIDAGMGGAYDAGSAAREQGPVTPTPTYTIASQPGSINSGGSGTFDITTTDVADGTTLYWTINNVTSTDADFTAVSGSFVITSNAGVFDVITVSGIESDVTFTASIRTVSIAGTVVDTSDSVTINLDPATASGSMFIPGTSSRITLTPGIVVGGTSTTPFTVEGWFYSTVTPGTDSGPVLLSTDTSSATPSYAKALTINISSTTQIIVDSNGASQQGFNFAETMLVNTWYYVAVTRDSSGFIQVWMGKKGDTNATASTTGRIPVNGDAAWELTGLSNCVGAFVPAGRYTSGYISNLRVDSTGLYATAAATIPVPTEPFAELPGTVFLQNDATLTDQTGTQTLAAVGSAAGDVLNPWVSTPTPPPAPDYMDICVSEAGAGEVNSDYTYAADKQAWIYEQGEPEPSYRVAYTGGRWKLGAYTGDVLQSSLYSNPAPNSANPPQTGWVVGPGDTGTAPAPTIAYEACPPP